MKREEIARKRAIIAERDKLALREVVNHSNFKQLTKTALNSLGIKKGIQIEYVQEGEDGFVAFTEGKRIYVNIDNHLTASFPTIELKMISLLGIIYHEVGHLLYTDFSLRAEYLKEIGETGVFKSYYKDKKTMEEVQKYFKKYPSLKTIASMMMGTITNIVEDSFEEKILCINNKGAVKKSVEANREKIYDLSISLKEKMDRKLSNQHILAAMISEYASSGAYNNWQNLVNKYTEAMEKAKPLILEAIASETAQGRLNKSTDIFLSIWSVFKDEIDDLDKRIKITDDADEEKSPSGMDEIPKEGDIEVSKSESSSDKSKKADIVDALIKDMSDKFEEEMSDSEKEKRDETSEMFKGKKPTPKPAKPKESEDKALEDNPEETSDEKSETGKEPFAALEDGLKPSDSDKAETTSDTTTDTTSDTTTETIKSEEKVANEDDGKDEVLELILSESSTESSTETGAKAENEEESGKSSDKTKDLSKTCDKEPEKDFSEDFSEELTEEFLDELFEHANLYDIEDDINEEIKDSYKTEEEIPANDEPIEDAREKVEIDLDKIIDEICTEKVVSEELKEEENELNKELASINLGPLSNSKKAEIKRICKVSEEQINNYNIFSKKPLEASRKLAQRLKKINNQKERSENNLFIGTKIDNVYQRQGRVFSKKIVPNKKDLAILYLIDMSGSMEGRRIEMARESAIMIEDACSKLKIPLQIAGHSEQFCGETKVQYFVFKNFESRDNKDKYRLAEIKAMENNRDGAALRIAGEQLLKRNEQERILIIVSDGEPCADMYRGKSAIEDVKNAVKSLKKRGIKVFAAAIGDDKKEIEHIYEDSFIDISQLDKLPVIMSRLIEKFAR